MRILGIQTSPNKEGLTSTAAQRALEGARKAGAETELVHLRRLKIEACRACEEGWGRCRREGLCIIEDDMRPAWEKIEQADAVVISTPVYFGEVSEVTKSFLDRLRRCRVGPREWKLDGKPALCIAAPGGGGRGGPTTLVQLDRYLERFGMPPFDWLIVTRRNRSYQLAAAERAGEALVAFVGEQATKRG
jgi:multimeric flavodoxin WrbA